MNAGGGDDMAERVVGTSLSMLKDADARGLLLALALAPEDVRIPPEAADFIWRGSRAAAEVAGEGPEGACAGDGDGGGEGGGKAKVKEKMYKAAQAGRLRRCMALLLRRTLTMGSVAEGGEGLFLHDLVRDYARSLIQREARVTEASSRSAKSATICERQAAFVRELIKEGNGKGWKGSESLTAYLAANLQQHMKEALPLTYTPAVLANDAQVVSWLSSSVDVLGDVIVVAAAATVGVDVLLLMAEMSEQAGDAWAAARRFVSAAIDTATTSRGPVLKRACEALVRVEPSTEESRTLEVLFRAQAHASGVHSLMGIPLTDPWVPASISRMGTLLTMGVAVLNPKGLFQLGFASCSNAWTGEWANRCKIGLCIGVRVVCALA
jgi:hypothetical protein